MGLWLQSEFAGVVSSPTGEDVTGKWLCEQKKGWGCIDVDEGDLESQIPLVSIFSGDNSPTTNSPRSPTSIGLPPKLPIQGIFCQEGKKRKKMLCQEQKSGSYQNLC